MRVFASVLVALLGAACTGNPVAPPAPSPSAPETAAPVPLPAAPKALLVVGRGELTPPLGIRNFTQLLFDGSQSSGEELTYLLDFGDGISITEPVARHRSEETGPLDARLTVTDKYGRSDSTTQTYYRHPVGPGLGIAQWWANNLQTSQGRVHHRTLTLAQDGATLSGWYEGPEGRKRLTGALSDDRQVSLRTQDGAMIELVGVLTWKGPDDLYAVLRLSVKGGMADGAVLDFHFRDPY